MTLTAIAGDEEPEAQPTLPEYMVDDIVLIETGKTFLESQTMVGKIQLAISHGTNWHYCIDRHPREIAQDEIVKLIYRQINMEY